ncbi:MAG: hypothetical protein SVS15_00220 [Thermodesulfobacteriota bacterium]|nr:hypothetical protein [Thermodesulfobacteriota bacterium]
MSRILKLFLVLGMAAGLFAFEGCAPSDKALYPAPENLELAPVQQREFVESFLQGRWCEAETLFAMSLENYLRQDDFCSAAHNYLLFWRLKAYLGEEDAKALENAKRMRRLGLGCPADERLSFLDADLRDQAFSPKDKAYRSLLEKEKFSAVMKRLNAEEDRLFVSVYSRKAGLLALDRGEEEIAGVFFEKARAVDAKLGWVVFLREDWRLLISLTKTPEEKQAIADRIQCLDEFIQPCRK